MRVGSRRSEALVPAEDGENFFQKLLVPSPQTLEDRPNSPVGGEIFCQRAERLLLRGFLSRGAEVTAGGGLGRRLSSSASSNSPSSSTGVEIGLRMKLKEVDRF